MNRYEKLFEGVMWAFCIVCVIAITIMIWSNLSPAYGQYYNLDDITKDQYIEKNEGLQPEYWPKVEEPNLIPLECGIERETPLKDYLGEKEQGNGLTAYLFDSNGDGKFDVMISLPSADVNRHPLYYFFDRDYDGHPDIGYIDIVRDGKCYYGKESNIKVYWTPKMEEDRLKEEGRIKENDCVKGDCDTRQEGVL